MMRVERIERAATLLVAVVLLAINASGAAAQTPPDPLVGVRKVTVLVDYKAIGSPPGEISESRLQTILELKLRTAGLRVLTQQENLADPDINPYVYLRVATLKTQTQGGRTIGYTYRLDLAAKVAGNVPFNRARVPMELWSNSTMAVSDRDRASSHIESLVGQLTDLFLNAWRKANPRE